jgi:hypothetical protein
MIHQLEERLVGYMRSGANDICSLSDAIEKDAGELVRVLNRPS